MLGWMNEESFRRTRESGEVWFWSRSRQELWHKGATSGNKLTVREIRADCDADCLLIRAVPAGPTCHTGRESCFWRVWDERSGRFLEPEDIPRSERSLDNPPSSSFLDELEDIVASRRLATPDESYTARLFEQGRFKIAQKVGEEGLEAAMAGVVQGDDRLIDESADLLFHLIVLLNERGIRMGEVLARLNERHSDRTSIHE
jgi:phosphoribosyl-ATP pyrophosphohydrolase/phosphoribosyl-AMP cyclohydrolase